MINSLHDVSTMSVVDLTGRLKEAEEVFEEAAMSLQQDGTLYLTEEGWDARRKKREMENHSRSSARGGGAGKRCWRDRGRGRDNSSSSGSLSKRIGDECRCYDKMGDWARECHLKPKEQAHITQDENDASLMLATTTLICPEAEEDSPLCGGYLQLGALVWPKERKSGVVDRVQ
jgi:hypothetical protein